MLVTRAGEGWALPAADKKDAENTKAAVRGFLGLGVTRRPHACLPGHGARPMRATRSCCSRADEAACRVFANSPGYRAIALDRLAGADAVVLLVKGIDAG